LDAEAGERLNDVPLARAVASYRLIESFDETPARETSKQR
jgi:hypothetical protein